MSDLAAHKEKGNGFFKQQKYPDAIEWYTKAIQAGGPPAELGAIYSNRAASYIALKKFSEAVGDADECIKCRPDWVKGYFRRAAALEAKGDLDSAEKSFNDALKREEGNVDIKDRLTAIRAKLKERNEKADPSSCASSQDAKLIGNSVFKTGNYEKAILFYTRAIELSSESDPERATYYVNRALCHAQTSSHKRVIADCEEALLIQPENAKALLRRGMAYEGLEKWQKGLDDYKKVISMGTNSPQATEGQARCQRALRSM